MKRYFSVLGSFIRNNLIRDMEFRGHFVMLLFMDLFWVGFQIVLVQIYFQYTDSILGWNRGEIFLLVGFFRFVKGLVDVFARRNIFNIPDYMVTRGNLDLVLTKPVNSAFLVSFRYQEFSDLGSFVGGLAIIIYSFFSGVVSSSFLVILQLLFLSVFAALAFYALLFLFSTVSFFIPKLSALRPYYDLLSNFFRYPADVFTGGRFLNETFLIPLVVVTTLPVRILLGRASLTLIGVEILIVSLLVFAAYRFWNFGLKHYTSAN